MENKEKIEKLEKEIEDLEKKKKESDEFNELLDKRNRLKFTKLYSAGRFLKKMGSGISEWADKKNKAMDEEEKTKEKKVIPKSEPRDLYEDLFGETDLNKQMGF